MFCVTILESGNSFRDKARKHSKYAIKSYEQDEGLLLITEEAKLYMILKTTLYYRING